MWIKRKDTSPISLHSEDSKAVFKMASGLKKNNSKVGGSITRGVGIRPLSCRTPHESQTTQQRHKRAYLNSPKVTPRHAEVWHKSDEERHDLAQGKTRLNFLCLTLKTIVVKTKKTFYLFCICHASWLTQKSHATFSANQTESIVTCSDAFRLRLQDFVYGSDYFIWWSDSFTIGRPIYLVSGCKTTCSNHSNNVPKPFLAINGSGKVCGKGRKLGVQNRDFSHFSNSSFHIENEICGSVTSCRGENTQPPFLMTTQVEFLSLTDTKNLAIFSASSKNSCQRKQAPNRINNINKKHDYTSLEFSALKSRPHFLETRERGEKPAHVWSCTLHPKSMNEEDCASTFKLSAIRNDLCFVGIFLSLSNVGAFRKSLTASVFAT